MEPEDIITHIINQKLDQREEDRQLIALYEQVTGAKLMPHQRLLMGHAGGLGKVSHNSLRKGHKPQEDPKTKAKRKQAKASRKKNRRH